MKKLNLLSIAVLSVSLSFGQGNWCGTDQQMEIVFTNNPEQRQGLHEQLIRINSSDSPFTDRGVNGTVPVVIHVIHDGAEGNIDYDQILDGLNIINMAYQKLNPDTVDTRNTATAPFAPIAANIGISFELAKLDPDGNCTNGVERIYSPTLTNNADDDCKYASNGGLDGWPIDEYLNIWVVNSIDNGGGAGITLGYASLPYFAVDETHGILIRHDAFGTIGTSNSDGETLTHEVGHILGLLHTFQAPFFGGTSGCHSDDCSAAGDYICDTPPVDVNTWSCNDSQNSCSDIPVGDFYGFDANDQYENWMSYDACQNMFTEDQKTIILTNFVDISFMANWISPANNLATGVGLPDVLCLADFSSSATVICAGDSVNFYDGSYFNITGTAWTFTGGTPSSSSISNPVITYNTPGLYSVSLDVTDGTSNLSTTSVDYIMVLPSPGEALPYFEGFELMSALTDNNRFSTVNDDGGVTWEHNDGVGIQGSKCAYINNFGNSNESTDYLISNTIDLSTVSASDPMVFTFQYAYRKITSTDDEWLKFYVSNDCGETWVLRKNIHGNGLSTQTLTSAFTDPADLDWTMVTIGNITSTYYTENFRFRFEFINDGGNNIFIDDINLFPESMTGLINLENSTNLSIYPNPSSDNITIDIIAQEGAEYTIELYSTLGAKIDLIYEGQLNGGLNQLFYSTENLPKGLYIVKVASEEKFETIKLIKE